MRGREPVDSLAFHTLKVLGLFFDTLLMGNVILLDNRIPIEIVPACVAGSAYYLLLILNLSIAKIKLKTRIQMIHYLS